MYTETESVNFQPAVSSENKGNENCKVEDEDLIKEMLISIDLDRGIKLPHLKIFLLQIWISIRDEQGEIVNEEATKDDMIRDKAASK